jgi:hypothetical protein
MVFSEFEIKRIEKSVDKFMEKRRPAPHIRNQVDLGFKIKNQSLELFEIRPRCITCHTLENGQSSYYFW